MNRRISILILISAILLCAVPFVHSVATKQIQRKINGKVVDSNGVPIAGIRVGLYQDGQRKDVYTTKLDGMYKLTTPFAKTVTLEYYGGARYQTTRIVDLSGADDQKITRIMRRPSNIFAASFNVAADRLYGPLGTSKKEGFRYLDTGLTMCGAFVPFGKDKYTTVWRPKLQGGKTYRFLVDGDAAAEDLDLRISTASGKVLKTDKRVSRNGIVTFRATSTQNYSIQVRNYKSSSNKQVACIVYGLVRNSR